MRFEVIKGTSGWRWRLTSNGGEVICNSVEFIDKLAALESIHAVRAWCKDAPVEEVKISKSSGADFISEGIKLLRKKT